MAKAARMLLQSSKLLHQENQRLHIVNDELFRKEGSQGKAVY